MGIPGIGASTTKLFGAGSTPAALAARTSVGIAKGYEYVDPGRERSRRLILGVDALEKDGKTRFALTAPGPIGYMDFDNRSEGTIEQFLRAGKKIAWRIQPTTGEPWPYQIPSDSGASDAAQKEVQDAARREWKRFEDDFEALLHCDVRTIVVDTATEAWALLRLAGFGRLDKIPEHLYGEVNGAFRRIIRLARQQNRVNLILLHRLGKEYRNEKVDGKLKGVETGNKERKGFAETGFLVDANIRLYRLPATQVGGRELGFRLTVKDCGANAKLRGLELADEMISFPQLASMITNGETSLADWE